MKTIFLIRHAKSNWSEPFSSDFERTLNARGLKDAKDMSQRLQNRNIPIDAFYVSSAVRTKLTAGIFAATLGMNNIHYIDEMYHADLDVWNNVISNIDDKYNTVAMFGHNNGITDFANTLTQTRIDNMPTCCIFAVSADCENWSDFDTATKHFLFVDYPKLR